jgi:hypothetical protein
MASYVVTLMTMGLNGLNNWPWWGAKWGKLSVQRFMLAIATNKSVAKSFNRSWAYFLAWFWGFEGYEHGPRTNTRWMILGTDYSRTLTAQELATSTIYTWLAGIELMLQGRRDGWHEAESTGISKWSLRRKGRLMKEFQIFLYKRWLQAELQNNLAHTFTYFANLPFW